MFAEVNNFLAVCKKLREVVKERPEKRCQIINLNDISSLTNCLETAVNAIDQRLQKVETRVSALENNVLFLVKGMNSALEGKQNGAVENEIQEQGEEQPLKRRRGRKSIKDVTVPVD